MNDKEKERIEKCVVQIECINKSNHEDTELGTGFFIEKDIIVTASHVIDKYYTNPSDYFINVIPIKTGIDRDIKVRRLIENKRNNFIAILELEESIGVINPLKFTLGYKIKRDDKYFTFGHPISKRDFGYLIENKIATDINETQSKRADWDLKIDGEKSNDFSGFSGAPVVIDNMVIGIIQTQSVAEGKALSIAMSSINVMKKYIPNDYCRNLPHSIKDVDLDYLSDLTKCSFENLGVRFNKRFNIDVELTNTLNKFCLTKQTISSLYEDLKNIKSTIWQLSSLVDNDLVKKLDVLIKDIIDEKIFDYTLMKSDFEFFAESVYKELENKHKKYSKEYYNSYEYYYYRTFESGNSDLDKYRQALGACTLIVTGSAGIGKSHSIANFCNEVFYLDNKICIFILGQHLNELSNPVEMIEKILHIPYTLQKFLDSLEEIAKSDRTVVPFVVEAINEGRNSEVWRESFSGIISIFERYKWIKLIISVRTTYIEKCLPEGYKDCDNILVVEHKGFENNSIEAVTEFFKFYEIPVPTFPILYAEYYNPLFLHTLCKTLKKLDNNIISEYSSFSIIFEKYLDVIENAIALRMNYMKSLRLVKRVTDKVIEYSLKNHNRYGIEIAEFHGIVQKITKQFELNCNSLVQLLFDEGLFYPDIYSHESKEYVQFSYERYHNILTAKYILKDFSTREEIIISLNNGVLKNYMENSYSGITEELFIMIPDKFSIELLSLLSKAVAVKNLQNYINSLLWRNKSNFLVEDTKKLLNKYVVKRKYFSNEFIKMLFILSPIENHPLNILFLQEYLDKMTMAIRDNFLADTLYDGYAVNITLRNLVDFCFTSAIKDCSEESIKLMAYMISWSLSSTNLTYRKSVVRALVALFEDNIELIRKVIINFKNVNDPYIKEGIYCAVYGAVLRCKSFNSEMGNLINEIYNDIFKSTEVYPNILVRDYARGVIEYAKLIGIEITFNLEEIRPPYKSCWYKNIPTQEEIDGMRYDYKGHNLDRKMYATNEIISSMTTNTGSKHMMYGDFGRYVFEGWVKPWNYHFIEQNLSNIVTKEIFTTLGYKPELHGDFDQRVKSYNRNYSECERIGKKYQRIASYELIARLSDNFPAGSVEYIYSDKYIKNHHNKLKNVLLDLSEEADKTEEINDVFDKELYDGEDIEFDEIDVELQNEIEDINEDYRRKIFTECPYEGPWQIGIRGVDPTVLLEQSIKSEKDYLEHKFKIPNMSDEEWASVDSSEPEENEILIFKEEDEEFVVLRMCNSWYSKQLRLDEKVKQYFVDAIALFVDRKNCVHELINDEEIKKYCSNGSNYGTQDIYAREFPWAPSYISFKNEIQNDYNEEEKCYIETEILYNSPNPSPHDEVNGVTSFSMPSEFIIEKLELKQIEDGRWYDKEGNLIAYDMIFRGYKSMLVINKNSLLKLLDENNLEILWAMYTEKEGGKYHCSQRKIVGLIDNKLQRNVFDIELWESKLHF